MARPIRIEYAGALYHITSRGDRKEDIYESDSDRIQFLEILGQVCDRFNWIVHAYCLMPNHYHLIVETVDGHLSQGMRQLNGVYTQAFNRSHGRVGHVFHGRFKAILVEKENYLLELGRYVVLNPVRASMVKEAVDWPWSSYRQTIGLEPKQKFIETDFLLAAFGKTTKAAIEGYKRFVSEGRNQPSPWKYLKNQIYLGSDKFVEQMLTKIPQDKLLSEIPIRQRRAKVESLTYYASQAATRNDGIIRSYASGGYTQQQIGDYYGLHYSTVSEIISNQNPKTKT